MKHWVLLGIALTLNASANVLLKVGSKLSDPEATGSVWAKLINFLNWPTLLGIVLFAANVLVYRKALDALNVSVAYPIMVSLGLIIVTLAAVYLPVLRERVTLWQLAGMCLIGAGVWMVASG